MDRFVHAYPVYKDFESRLFTFLKLNSKFDEIKKRKLADAGFFYCGDGISDDTKCYSCGGGLNNWLVHDDPWEQHTIWFPRCYLVKNKNRKKEQLPKTVTFSDVTIYHSVPGRRENRLGTWHLDAAWSKFKNEI